MYSERLFHFPCTDCAKNANDLILPQASVFARQIVDRVDDAQGQPSPAAESRQIRLERVPITWNHVIGKDSLKFKELEHVLIEKVEQLFRDIL